MKLPHGALVLIADGRKRLFLRNHGDDRQIDLRVEEHDEQMLARDADIKTDLAGQSPAPAGTGLSGGTMQESDYQQQAEDRWAADTADLLRQRALAQDFDALVVIAAPKLLGVLRKNYHVEVERRLVTEIAKTMTDRPVADLEALLDGEAGPPS